MSWKIYLVVITNAVYSNLAELPEKIGVGHLNPKKEVSIMEAQYLDKGMSIGKYEDKIIIVSSPLVFDLLEKKDSEVRNKLFKIFPKSEIAVLTTGYVNGYSIIKDGITLRTYVIADLKSFVNYGQKLAEEIEAYNEISSDKDLMNMIREESPEDLEAVINENVGESTVFKLTKRYFNQRIDEEGSAFENIILTHYE
ncbi:hypothetical protein [Chryseobacterium takakiae]|uniref:Uncharacterized protein n=1 Tax=Chryseobacterium takakiae TaxID=1302685 RepID=A0A1M5AUK0_9FLAO|nr:hypothetical protein [Chryseobacterium takakiae]SHF33948.1 hypothetical protein SAMN05444408_11537 [Chryseobacterium takakiae]